MLPQYLSLCERVQCLDSLVAPCLCGGSDIMGTLVEPPAVPVGSRLLCVSWSRVQGAGSLDLSGLHLDTGTRA